MGKKTTLIFLFVFIRIWFLKEWIAIHNKKEYDKIKNSIDILIATDVLSEGQNLKDYSGP